MSSIEHPSDLTEEMVSIIMISSLYLKPLYHSPNETMKQQREKLLIINSTSISNMASPILPKTKAALNDRHSLEKFVSMVILDTCKREVWNGSKKKMYCMAECECRNQQCALNWLEQYAQFQLAINESQLKMYSASLNNMPVYSDHYY